MAKKDNRELSDPIDPGRPWAGTATGRQTMRVMVFGKATERGKLVVA